MSTHDMTNSPGDFSKHDARIETLLDGWGMVTPDMLDEVDPAQRSAVLRDYLERHRDKPLILQGQALVKPASGGAGTTGMGRDEDLPAPSAAPPAPPLIIDNDTPMKAPLKSGASSEPHQVVTATMKAHGLVAARIDKNESYAKKNSPIARALIVLIGLFVILELLVSVLNKPYIVVDTIVFGVQGPGYLEVPSWLRIVQLVVAILLSVWLIALIISQINAKANAYNLTFLTFSVYLGAQMFFSLLALIKSLPDMFLYFAATFQLRTSNIFNLLGFLISISILWLSFLMMKNQSKTTNITGI